MKILIVRYKLLNYSIMLLVKECLKKQNSTFDVCVVLRNNNNNVTTTFVRISYFIIMITTLGHFKTSSH